VSFWGKFCLLFSFEVYLEQQKEFWKTPYDCGLFFVVKREREREAGLIYLKIVGRDGQVVGRLKDAKDCEDSHEPPHLYITMQQVGLGERERENGSSFRRKRLISVYDTLSIAVTELKGTIGKRRSKPKLTQGINISCLSNAYTISVQENRDTTSNNSHRTNFGSVNPNQQHHCIGKKLPTITLGLSLSSAKAHLPSSSSKTQQKLTYYVYPSL
jgi:hypothetical protein